VPFRVAASVEPRPLAFRNCEVLASEGGNLIGVGLGEQGYDEPGSSRAAAHASQKRQQIRLERDLSALVRFRRLDSLVLVVPRLGDANLLIIEVNVGPLQDV
jgi:hypothetical protein